MSGKTVFRNVMAIILPGVDSIITDRTNQIYGQLLEKAVLLSLEVILLVLDKDVTVSDFWRPLYQVRNSTFLLFMQVAFFLRFSLFWELMWASCSAQCYDLLWPLLHEIMFLFGVGRCIGGGVWVWSSCLASNILDISVAIFLLLSSPHSLTAFGLRFSE